jgi:hypothetical protein
MIRAWYGFGKGGVAAISLESEATRRGREKCPFAKTRIQCMRTVPEFSRGCADGGNEDRSGLQFLPERCSQQKGETYVRY